MDLKTVLYTWAKCDGERMQQLQEWLDDAIMKCAQNMGQNIASTSANGISVSFMSNSLTINEWIVALSGAIDLINNPAKRRNKAVQIFR